MYHLLKVPQHVTVKAGIRPGKLFPEPVILTIILP